MPATSPGSRTIVHVAQVEISRDSGMGRVAWHWRQELEARGYRFVHLGPAAVGRPVHPALFPFAAWRQYRRLRLAPAAILAHEPAGLPFLAGRRRRPVIAFSHGVERRGWETALAWPPLAREVRPRSRLLFPLWRLRPADAALARASAVLVLNADDRAFVERRYRRRAEDVFVFRNGVDPAPPAAPAALAAPGVLALPAAPAGPDAPGAPALPAVRQDTRAPSAERPPTVLFVGSWIARKGIATLVEAAAILRARGIAPRFVLAGTGRDAPQVLACWPPELRPAVTVVPRFDPAQEAALYAGADLFVLPSFFEGQPLALLQAMAAGCCCVASDIGGTRDLIAHGESGMLHPPGDAGQLAQRAAECLAAPSLRERLGEGARRAVAGRGWDTVAREVIDFVENVIDRQKREAPGGESPPPDQSRGSVDSGSRRG
jgi:glycosyltransferase involved in cell wall biosynthesis